MIKTWSLRDAYIHNIMCLNICFLPQASLLSTMVETAWKWAAERGKVKKSEVNGAEYAELEVDRVRTKVSEAESTMSMAAGCVFQDVSVVGCYAILYGLHLFSSVCVCFGMWQDTTGSILDAVDEVDAGQSVTGASPQPTPAAAIPCLAGILHACDHAFALLTA